MRMFRLFIICCVTMNSYLLFILIGDQQHLSTLHSPSPMQNKGKVLFCVCKNMHMYVCIGMIMTQCLLFIVPTKLAITPIISYYCISNQPLS